MKVAVIGAGMAGLTAAAEAQQRGATVTVFEKARGVGGRMANKRLPWCEVNIGAQYFTARDPRFVAQVRRWQQSQSVRHWDFQPHAIEADVLKLSADNTRRFVGTPTMNAPLRHMAADLQVNLNTRMVALNRWGQAGQWALRSEAGQVFAGFDWVFLTLPAEQSDALLSSSHLAAGALAKNIPKAVHDPCWALVLATEGEVSEPIQGIFGDSTISWVSRVQARAGIRPQMSHDTWVLHFAAEWSRLRGKRLRGKQGSDLAQIGLQWLQSRLQQPLRLVHSYEHFWRYAKLKRGAAEHAALVDTQQKIAVIGDWCSGGRVEGAYISAVNTVDEIFQRASTL